MNTLPPIHKRPNGWSPSKSVARTTPPAPTRDKTFADHQREFRAKLKVLRQLHPSMTRSETRAYRYSHFHSLSVTMLQNGFHRSFTELLMLVEVQKESREIAGPDSTLWYQTSILNENEKLDQLKKYLTKAEAAVREGRIPDIYDAQFTLARYFLSTGDDWLSDYFFEAALKTCEAMPNETRKVAEANCNSGLMLQRAGEFHRAAQLFDHAYQLAKNENWEDDNGRPLAHVACAHLAIVYTNIAHSFASKDLTKSLEFLLKAYRSVKRSHDTHLDRSTCYKLGLTYEKVDDYENALCYIKRFYDICELLCDNHGIVLAHEATGRCYLRLGKMDACVRYLRLSLRVAEDSGVDSDIGRACSGLATVYNNLGLYQEAAKLFTKAFEISCRLNERENVEILRVQCGIAFGHKMLANVTRHVDGKLRVCVERLLDWKDARTDSMGGSGIAGF